MNARPTICLPSSPIHHTCNHLRLPPAHASYIGSSRFVGWWPVTWRVVGRLTHCLLDWCWLLVHLFGCLAGCFICCFLVGWFAGRFGGLVTWVVGWLVAWVRIAWLVVVCLVGWRTRWLVDLMGRAPPATRVCFLLPSHFCYVFISRIGCFGLTLQVNTCICLVLLPCLDYGFKHSVLFLAPPLHPRILLPPFLRLCAFFLCFNVRLLVF